MYYIIGADGKQYGPVSAETLVQWIAQGRTNPQTKARVDGTEEWKELAAIPEFAAALAAKAQTAGSHSRTEPRYATVPFHGAAAAEAMARNAILNDYRFDISRCFSRAWDLLLANFWLSVGTSLLILLITAVAGAVPFAALLLASVFMGGLDWMFLRMLRGERAELNDAFAGFTIAFVPLMLFSLVSQLLIGLGYILCILPGIYLTVVWMPFAALLIIDKKLEFWPAMELSRKVISNHWWQMLGFLLLCWLVNLAGTALLCVGFLVTFPLTTIAIVVAYEEVFSRVNPPPEIAAPPAPQPGA